MSTLGCHRCVKAERDWDHRDCGCGCHELPGEQERMAFHFHEFEHDCYRRHCPESDRLYAQWQIALGRARQAGYRP